MSGANSVMSITCVARGPREAEHPRKLRTVGDDPRGRPARRFYARGVHAQGVRMLEEGSGAPRSAALCVELLKPSPILDPELFVQRIELTVAGHVVWPEPLESTELGGMERSDVNVQELVP
jgi:hypothetical protein